MAETLEEKLQQLTLDYEYRDRFIKEKTTSSRYINQVSDSLMELLYNNPQLWGEYNALINKISLCFPIESENSVCKEPWVLESFISKGWVGNVWVVCCGANCNYALKYVCFTDCDPFRPTNKVKILDEILLQQCASAVGLAPKIIDAWICNNSSGALIISEIMNKTVQQLLIENPYPTVWVNILKNVFEMVARLHEVGIIHRDPHFRNIMVKSSQNIPNKDEYMFVDFGESCALNDAVCPGVKSTSCNLIDDYFQLEIEIRGILSTLEDIMRDVDKDRIRVLYANYKNISKQKIPELINVLKDVLKNCVSELKNM